MIHCCNEPITASLPLPSLRLQVSGQQQLEDMSSGYQHLLYAGDIGTNDHSTHAIAGPVDEVKSTDQRWEDRPKPKRPLSAYNWFFHSERQNILDETPTRKEGKPRRSHGKIGFADLARLIAAKWKGLSIEDRAVYDEKARVDKERYVREMEEWKKWQSLAVSQQPTHSTGGQGDMMSFPNDTFNVSAIVGHPSFFPSYSLGQVPPPTENVLSNEMKTSSRDFFTTDAYSLSDIFGAEITRRLQAPSSHNVSLPPLPASESAGRRVSPNMRLLASQLGDEETELFLDLFRDADWT